MRDLYLLPGRNIMIDATPPAQTVAQRIHKKLSSNLFTYPIATAASENAEENTAKVHAAF